MTIHLENQIFLTGGLWLAIFLAGPAQGGDWPTWCYDAQRSAATPEALPDHLQILWSRQLPQSRPAWPKSQFKLRFDDSYEPIVLGKRIIIGSTVNDSITAYDTEQGQQLWRFYTAGPVRFAPVAYQGRVYAVSDDGHLYCLAVDDGHLLWKVNGAPAVRPILGNDRLISTWPARGGPVLMDDIVYFTTGIWPSMGIFIHAVDAATGEILWTNDQMGSKFMVHPHGASSFGSIVPQGYLVACDQSLIVPGGRTTPAVFDRQTGQLIHFRFDRRLGDFRIRASSNKGASHGKGADGGDGQGQYFLAGGRFDLADGKQIGYARPQVLSDQKTWELADRKLTVRSLRGQTKTVQKKDRRGKSFTEEEFMAEPGWSMTIPPEAPGTLYLKAGNEIFTGGPCRSGKQDSSNKQAVARFDVRPWIDAQNGVRTRDQVLSPVWLQEIDGSVSSMLAADDKLLVVTVEGTIYCFGQKQGDSESANVSTKGDQAKVHTRNVQFLETSSEDGWAERVASILKLPGAAEGYAIAWGIGSGRMIEELAQDVSRQLIVVDADPQKVLRLRQRMDAAGCYGTRVTAQIGNPDTFPFPPYLANLIVVEAPQDPTEHQFLQNLFHALRPYGGVACLRIPLDQQELFANAVANAKLAQAQVKRYGEFALLIRAGKLPGSADWTHQYADAANSSVSHDQLVKAPLGLLWFGGPSHDKVLPRHGHGPSPHVVGGRLFIEGPDMLRAVDVYTGRLLWEKSLPRVGSFYNITSHFSGAGEYGSNYVSLPDRIYMIHENKILALDSTNGAVTREFQLEVTNESQASHWSYLTAWNDLLIATSNPVQMVQAVSQAKTKGGGKLSMLGSLFKKKIDKEEEKGTNGKKPKQLYIAAEHSSTSRHLVVFNRHTGQQLWSRDAKYSFRHNCLVVGSDKIFLLDGLSPKRMDMLRRRGIDDRSKPRLWALQADTGEAIWSTEQELQGTFLSYSVDYDVLLQGGSNFRDRAKDEVRRGLVAYQGATGKLLWKDKDIVYDGPCLLWKDKIITNGNRGFQLELLTGNRTGWSFSRMYGCNSIIGSEHLLTFRSGAAGFCDLASDSGTGNLGGFKSSCTSNLIVADGVLNAPDYTRTCSCAYQNQTSLAWIHMPEADTWTYNQRQLRGLSERIGINFGAPGDRRGENGTLWLEYPQKGGPSPAIHVTTVPDKPSYFSYHTSRIRGEGLKWVAASGVEGIESLRILLDEQESANQPTEGSSKSYMVRLYFSEPNSGIQPGERTFSVAMQGVTILPNFDIVKTAGGSNRPVVREFLGVHVGTDLEITFSPSAASAIALPILCGVELIAE